MTQEKTDPAAFLAECARVHEDGIVAFAATHEPCDTETILALAARNAAADKRRTATYGALLEVARGLVEERDMMRSVAADESLSVTVRGAHDFAAGRLDSVLSRLAAGGGGT